MLLRNVSPNNPPKINPVIFLLHHPCSDSICSIAGDLSAINGLLFIAAPLPEVAAPACSDGALLLGVPPSVPQARLNGFLHPPLVQLSWLCWRQVSRVHVSCPAGRDGTVLAPAGSGESSQGATLCLMPAGSWHPSQPRISTGSCLPLFSVGIPPFSKFT